jgi:uncharacterized protein YjbI with pentapeptide repeats
VQEGPVQEGPVPPDARTLAPGPCAGPGPHASAPGKGTTWEGEDFARVDWDWTELERVTFLGCRFEEASLVELVTRRCVFEQCVLTGVSLSGSRHEGTAFLSCRFDRATLFDVAWEDCKLTGSQFPGATLRPMTATGCDWSYASLRGVDLSGVDLSGQRLTEADLTDADLRGADLSGADLRHARLQGATLRGADLRGAVTDGVDWRGFDPTGARLDLGQAVQFVRAHGALVEA